MAKSLSWEDLATIYDKRTGGKARTRPMHDIFKWAERQEDISKQSDGTLVLLEPVPENCPECGDKMDEEYACCSNKNCDYFA